MLKIEDLIISVDKKRIVKGLDLVVDKTEIHAVMGPNGSGKSTLAQVLMGHPGFEVEEGNILYKGKDLLVLKPNERSMEGLFLSFQYPSEVSGVNVGSYLRMVYNKRAERKLSPVKFRELLKDKLELLDLSEDFLSRYLNEGFSGGEKKRMEMLQMLVLEPELAILDEVDSGLDVDAIKVVAKAVNHLHKEKNMTVIIITHYARILYHIKPNKVHIIKDGKIVESGGFEVAERLEEEGYKSFEE